MRVVCVCMCVWVYTCVYCVCCFVAAMCVLCSRCAEGVMVAKKDFNLPKHPEVDVPNLHVIKMMQSMKSRGDYHDTTNRSADEAHEHERDH